MARPTRHLSPREPAARCLPPWTCPASSMRRHVHASGSDAPGGKTGGPPCGGPGSAPTSAGCAPPAHGGAGPAHGPGPPAPPPPTAPAAAQARRQPQPWAHRRTTARLPLARAPGVAGAPARWPPEPGPRLRGRGGRPSSAAPPTSCALRRHGTPRRRPTPPAPPCRRAPADRAGRAPGAGAGVCRWGPEARAPGGRVLAPWGRRQRCRAGVAPPEPRPGSLPRGARGPRPRGAGPPSVAAAGGHAPPGQRAARGRPPRLPAALDGLRHDGRHGPPDHPRRADPPPAAARAGPGGGAGLHGGGRGGGPSGGRRWRPGPLARAWMPRRGRRGGRRPGPAWGRRHGRGAWRRWPWQPRTPPWRGPWCAGWGALTRRRGPWSPRRWRWAGGMQGSTRRRGGPPSRPTRRGARPAPAPRRWSARLSQDARQAARPAARAGPSGPSPAPPPRRPGERAPGCAPREVRCGLRTREGATAWDTCRTLAATATTRGGRCSPAMHARVSGTSPRPSLAALLVERAHVLTLAASWDTA